MHLFLYTAEPLAGSEVEFHRLIEGFQKPHRLDGFEVRIASGGGLLDGFDFEVVSKADDFLFRGGAIEVRFHGVLLSVWRVPLVSIVIIHYNC